MRWSSFGLAIVLGCTAAPPLPTASADRDQALRARLAAADPEDRPPLEERLAQVDLKRAQEANTLFAYRRFLAEFPSGPEAAVARSLLATLAFQQAKRQGTRQAWVDFLDEFSRSDQAAAAREALGELDIREALRSDDLERVRAVLVRYPDNALRTELQRHEDDLAWKEAKSGGERDLERYLSRHPSGLHLAQAEARREALEQEELRAADDLSGAQSRARIPGAPAVWRLLVARLELERAERSLDLHALWRLADNRDPAVAPVSVAARALARSMRTDPPSRRVREAMAAARPGSGLPSRKALQAALGHGDPLAQVVALEELAEVGDKHDADAVLGALDSRYVAVRLGAVRAVASLAEALPPATRNEVLREKETAALSQAYAAGPWRRVAALREAEGHAKAALAAWQAVLRNDPDDLAARERVLALADGKGDLARTSAAQQLTKSAIAFGLGRCLPAPATDVVAAESASGTAPGVVVGVGDVTVLRQLCSAIDLAQEGVQALGGLAATAEPAAREDLDAEVTAAQDALAQLRSKRGELEDRQKEADASFVPCGMDPAAKPIAASRAARERAIARLQELADRRTLPFVESLENSASPKVRAAASAAAKALAALPPTATAPGIQRYAEPRRRGGRR